MAALVVSSFVANAQSEQWKAYWDICKQSCADMHAYPLLQKMTIELTKRDYEEFFALLWREVERGNLHAEDYASLYDRTYYRLHGKDWYGTEGRRPPSPKKCSNEVKHQ